MSTKAERWTKTTTGEKTRFFFFFVFFVFFFVLQARAFVAVAAAAAAEVVSGLSGIQRGANRVEYADSAFVVRHNSAGPEAGKVLHINTHRVQTSASWQFWEDVQCMDKLYVGKDGNQVEVGERLESIFATVESLTTQASQENADLKAENADLRAQYDALKAKVDNFFQPPSPPPSPPSPPPLPPPSPPPAPALTPIPSASWHSFVSECLAIDPVYGLCTTWDKYSTYGAMPDWDVSQVTDMSGWLNGPRGFHGKTSFNADITKWDTSGLKSMQAMFESTTSFQRDIGIWNTSGVTNMWATFKSSAFNRDISGWDTSSVTAMNAMFRYNTAFNQDISSWTGLAATTAQPFMFEGATAFQAKFSCTNAITGPASSCV